MMHRIFSDKTVLIYALGVLVIAFFTFFSNYYNPAAVFWDENYHIASAQKYLEGVMYMEPHPPLGKMFIALGEWLVHPNDGVITSVFVNTDYIKTFPKDYSFAGVRLFPTLFGMFSAVLFFFVLQRLSGRSEYAFLFAAFYLFENAFILQSRSAMLESTQMFFIFAAVLHFVILVDRETVRYRDYALMGVWIGLAFMVKANGLILVMLPFFLFLYKASWRGRTVKTLLEAVFKAATVLAAMAAVAAVVFYMHMAMGERVAAKKYRASAEYLKVIEEGQTANPVHFFTMLSDNLAYMENYSKGVPRYDPCKKGENGSLTATWPFGNKTINYRWAKDDGKVRYLYLVGNPVIWFGVVLGVVLATALVLARYVFGHPVKDRRLFFLIGVFAAVYWAYMGVMFNIERVMYLYHYFVALFFGVFLLFTLFLYLFKEELERDGNLLYAAVFMLAGLSAYVYWFFGPFTYYEPLSTYEFMQRSWFDFWKLKPIL